MTDDIDWRSGLIALKGDEALFDAIMQSDHPAARRFSRWLRHEVLPAIDPLGLRGRPGCGDYVWPSSRSALDALFSEATGAVRIQ